MKLAIFDFDGTILRGNTWRVFFWQEVKRDPLRAPWLLAAAALRRMKLVSAEWVQDQALAAWRGCTAEEIAETSRRFYVEHLRPRLRDAALAEIKRRRAEGYRIVVASAAWTPLLSPFVTEFAIETWTGTAVDFSSAQCAGRLVRPLTRGGAKQAWLLKTFPGAEVDWRQSCAFGDELLDVPMLTLVGEPVFVTRDELPPDLPAGTRAARWE